MRRKLSLLAIVLVCLMGGIYLFLINPFSHSSLNDRCPFCDSTIVNNQKFYEDDLVLALYTHKPILSGHCLIIPKRHAERFEMVTDDEIAHIGRVIKKINRAVVKVFGTSSYLLLQKNGREVGQSVPHLHFHYIPRKAGDDSMIQFIIKMYIANRKKPISKDEMRENVDKLKEAIECTTSG